MKKRIDVHRPEILLFCGELWIDCRKCAHDWPCPDWEYSHTAKQIAQQKSWTIRALNRRGSSNLRKEN